MLLKNRIPVRGVLRYKHVWPGIRFGWKVVVGTLLGFFGAAFGSVGGVGGGGFYVPMLTLIIGFDQKSSTAISKCTSIKSIFKGVDTWKKETKTKKVIFQNIYWFILFSALLDPSNTGSCVIILKLYWMLPNAWNYKVSVLENVYWKQLGIIASEWLIILGLQIAKNYVTICSAAYWSLDLLQIPVVVGPSSYQAIKLYQGQRVVASQGSETGANWTIYKLVFYCASGIAAGIVAGLLGLGGGLFMGPLFLEMGIPPQVSSATATFIMTFSSSMSVVEYYLLKRFPIPYALYFAGVATVSSILGQHVGEKVIKALGRASLIIFILAFTAFASALSLGGVGLAHLVTKIQHKEYLWFENMCTHKS
ncbi:putative transmembrane protein TauE [Rosa chinensis]|uniref:Putative transmembrane protein TauE n=1 Tax=Rosa chinensis TaxID=74649 RepID=A0A2P6PHV8_ROSCH|nr:putative transmembrane protein TauE [Rosa chinensis]